LAAAARRGIRSRATPGNTRAHGVRVPALDACGVTTGRRSTRRRDREDRLDADREAEGEAVGGDPGCLQTATGGTAAIRVAVARLQRVGRRAGDADLRPRDADQLVGVRDRLARNDVRTGRLAHATGARAAVERAAGRAIRERPS